MITLFRVGNTYCHLPVLYLKDILIEALTHSPTVTTLSLPRLQGSETDPGGQAQPCLALAAGGQEHHASAQGQVAQWMERNCEGLAALRSMGPLDGAV